MISEVRENTVIRRGVQAEGKFQIKATGKAFRILSDGLYSDKIKAIIRELSCNAYDAHVAANKLDTPFEIQLPNRLEPTFKIRDFGVGLSHHDVVNVYTTYFESTKTDSNDYIGCLGLGSKSPFSYVDNFSIVSYFNGKKRIYNAFISEDETPSIALMGRGRTNEPNGLEISFPVNINDISRFYDKARDVFTYFKLQPKFTGSEMQIAKVDYILEGSNWAVRKTSGSAKAIMGNVAYNLNDFSGNLEGVDSAVHSLIRYIPIDIRFNIGDLEVAASRESLSYNKRTIENIKQVLMQVVVEIRQKAVERIANCKTLWEARLLTHEIKTGEFSNLKMILEGQNIFEWNGTKLDGNSYIKISDALKATGINIQHFCPKDYYRRRSSNTAISNEWTSTIYAVKGSKFFVADMNKGSHIRCKKVISDSKAMGAEDIKHVYLIEGTETAIKMFKDEMGIVEVFPMISSIVVEKNNSVYNQPEYNPKNATKMLVYERNTKKHNSDTLSTYWNKQKIDLGAGGVYVKINRYKIGEEKPSEYIKRMNEMLESIGENLDNVEIIGVKEAAKDILINHKGWISLRDYVAQLISTYINENNLGKRIRLASQLHTFNAYRSHIQKAILDMDIDRTKPCGKFVKMYNGIKSEIGDINQILQIQQVASVLGITIEEVKDIDLAGEWTKVMELYPLFEVLDNYSIGESKEAVQEYINMMDVVKFNVDKEQKI